MASHQLTCMQLAIGLAGITVGLGARFPNLREPSPARIAAGFGGTLNLVVSSLYIAVIVLLTAVPCHFYFAMNGLPAGGLGRLLGEHFGLWLAAGNGVSLAVTALATAVPMRMGIRAFKRLEF
jgi:ABC-2 type transport system permease protein